jgi:hypothetical protein
MSELSQHFIWNMAMIIADDGPLRGTPRSTGVYLNLRAATLDNPEIKAKLQEILSRLSHTEAGPDDHNNIHATVKRPAQALIEAERWARRALELNDQEPVSHMALGNVLLWQLGRVDLTFDLRFAVRLLTSLRARGVGAATAQNKKLLRCQGLMA